MDGNRKSIFPSIEVTGCLGGSRLEVVYFVCVCVFFWGERERGVSIVKKIVQTPRRSFCLVFGVVPWGPGWKDTMGVPDDLKLS